MTCTSADRRDSHDSSEDEGARSGATRPKPTPPEDRYAYGRGPRHTLERALALWAGESRYGDLLRTLAHRLLLPRWGDMPEGLFCAIVYAPDMAGSSAARYVLACELAERPYSQKSIADGVVGCLPGVDHEFPPTLDRVLAAAMLAVLVLIDAEDQDHGADRQGTPPRDQNPESVARALCNEEGRFPEAALALLRGVLTGDRAGEKALRSLVDSEEEVEVERATTPDACGVAGDKGPHVYVIDISPANYVRLDGEGMSITASSAPGQIVVNLAKGKKEHTLRNADWCTARAEIKRVSGGKLTITNKTQSVARRFTRRVVFRDS